MRNNLSTIFQKIVNAIQELEKRGVVTNVVYLLRGNIAGNAFATRRSPMYHRDVGDWLVAVVISIPLNTNLKTFKMTRENFSKANELIAKIQKIEHKLVDLYNSELTINAKGNTDVWDLYKVEISKPQLLSILKYNREILKSQKEVLEKMLANI